MSTSNTHASRARWLVGPIFIAVAAVLWGLDGLLRGSLYILPAPVIVFYEALIGSLLITPFVIKKLQAEPFSKQDWLLITVIAFFSGLLGTLFFTEGLVRVGFIPISIVFLMQKLQPVFATISASIVLKEAISKQFVVWAGLALVAAYFVTFPGGKVFLEPGNHTMLAGALGLGAALCWGSATAFSRKFLLRHSVSVATGMRFYMTTIFALLAIPFLTELSAVPILSQTQFLALLAIALSTGLVALVLYYKGLQTTKASISTIIELIFPLMGVIIDAHKKSILGWFGVTGEYIQNSYLLPSQWVAGAILMLAIYQIAQLNTRTKPTPLASTEA